VRLECWGVGGMLQVLLSEPILAATHLVACRSWSAGGMFHILHSMMRASAVTSMLLVQPFSLQ
jgi:hypothetical protein